MVRFRTITQMRPTENKITIQKPAVSRASSTLEGHRLCLPTHGANTCLAETYFTSALRLRCAFVIDQDAQAVEVIASVNAEHLLARHKASLLSSAQERELDDIMEEAETVPLPSQARQTMSDRVKYDSFAAQCAVD